MTEMVHSTGVTREEFEAYVDVQMSGVTNMFAVNVVSNLSGLDRATIFTIMKHYVELEDFYKGENDVLPRVCI